MDHKIIRFEERIITVDTAGNRQLASVQAATVSTRKIHDFAAAHSQEYSHVARLISAALGVRAIASTTLEFSFTSHPAIVSALAPDEKCTDPVIVFQYDVFR